MSTPRTPKPCRRCGGSGFVDSPLDNGRCWRCNREPAPAPRPVAPEVAAAAKAYSLERAARRLATIEAKLADPTVEGTPAERARAEATVAQLRAELASA